MRVAEAINREMKPGVSYDEACQNLSKKMLSARNSVVSYLFDGITRGKYLEITGIVVPTGTPQIVMKWKLLQNFLGLVYKQRLAYVKKFFPSAIDEFEKILKGLI